MMPTFLLLGAYLISRFLEGHQREAHLAYSCKSIQIQGGEGNKKSQNQYEAENSPAPTEVSCCQCKGRRHVCKGGAMKCA